MDIPTSSVYVILTTLIRSDSIPLHTVNTFYGTCQLFRSDLSGWLCFPGCAPCGSPVSLPTTAPIGQYFIRLPGPSRRANPRGCCHPPNHTKSCLNLYHILEQIFYGAPGRTRTDDHEITNHALYQLSYRGKMHYGMYQANDAGLEPATSSAFHSRS